MSTLNVNDNSQRIMDDIMSGRSVSRGLESMVQRGEHYYRLVHPDDKPNGLWQRQSIEGGVDGNQWETLLDASDWSDATLVRVQLEPTHRKTALTYFSLNDSDKNEVFEFDVESGEFVVDGLHVDMGMVDCTWNTPDSIYAMFSRHEDDKTEYGYPSTIYLMERGNSPWPVVMCPLEIIGMEMSQEPGQRLLVTMYNTMTDRSFNIADGIYTTPLKLRGHYDVSLNGNNLMVYNHDDVNNYQASVKAGSLSVAHIEPNINRDTPIFLEPIFIPGPNRVLKESTWAGNNIYVTEEYNGRFRLLWHNVALGHGKCLMTSQGMMSCTWDGIPKSNSVNIDVSSWNRPMEVKHYDFRKPELTNVTLEESDSVYIATHRTATSTDGKYVSYDVISSEPLNDIHDARPTLITAYGGFGVSMMPHYDEDMINGWLKQDGKPIYVVAHIRGGGEQGPGWEALGRGAKGKLMGSDDVASVARDLIGLGVTDSDHLAFRGESNGGLIAGLLMTRYPELFAAISCGAPILDMKHYTEIGLGASWVDEYGTDGLESIDVVSLSRQSKEELPDTLFWAAKDDERVGTEHARRVVEALEQSGHFNHRYLEVDGGHSGLPGEGNSAYIDAQVYSFILDSIHNRQK